MLISPDVSGIIETDIGLDCSARMNRTIIVLGESFKSRYFILILHFMILHITMLNLIYLFKSLYLNLMNVEVLMILVVLSLLSPL